MVEVVIDEKIDEKLRKFKKVYDAVMGEESRYEEYVNLVITLGLEKMIRDAIPEGKEWETLECAFSKDFSFMSDLIAEIYNKGNSISEEEREESKEKIRKYIL